LAAAFGLCFLLEYLDNTIESSKEAEELLGLPVLGVIFDYQYNEDYERKEPCVNTI
jgi:capsular polysaccharide biosynthesis protein